MQSLGKERNDRTLKTPSTKFGIGNKTKRDNVRNGCRIPLWKWDVQSEVRIPLNAGLSSAFSVKRHARGHGAKKHGLCTTHDCSIRGASQGT